MPSFWKSSRKSQHSFFSAGSSEQPQQQQQQQQVQHPAFDERVPCPLSVPRGGCPGAAASTQHSKHLASKHQHACAREPSTTPTHAHPPPVADLPLAATRPSPRRTTPSAPFQRSSSVSNRQSTPNLAAQAADHRRSLAILPDRPALDEPNFSFYDESGASPPPGLARSSTVVRRDHPARGVDASSSPAFELPADPASPTPRGPSSHLTHPQDTSEQSAVPRADAAPMNHAPGKTSSDSGHQAGLDRWSQRRLQRLNTEQGFREQRQGGVSSPPASDSSSFTGTAVGYSNHAQPQPSLHQQPQPHHQGSYQAGARSSASPALHSQPVSSSRSANYPVHEQPQLVHMPAQTQYSPQEATGQLQENTRPPMQQSRSYSHHDEQQAMASANAGNLPAPKAVRAGNNRQSVHNGAAQREASSGIPSFNASVVPPATQAMPYQAPQPTQQAQQADVRRATPQPVQGSDDLSEEDVAQLVKDHKELREKYTKVKKYYFEKEDQVKQLQNSLAHQRLSQSRTSLDDSEYTTRFNRLDGLIAQLAFSIRKNWKSIPSWLVSSVNKDAVATGKQEMTAAGRAFISCWLVEEVFDKYFHPDLEPTLSAQLRSVQKNIRRYAPPAQTAEEEEFLISKVVNWRLSTLEGLQEALRSPQCPNNRAQLTDALKEGLVSALGVHLQDPPPADLEGGVHMIIELVVSIAIHLPLESRDVVIEYYMPGHSIVTDLMKLESGIPPLTISVADDAADRASMKSGVSDITDTDNTDAQSTGGGKKRSMLSALTGSDRKGRSAAQGKHATGSSGSLGRPDSQSGKEDLPPRVRLAAGIGVSVRGRTVLVKAPVFST